MTASHKRSTKRRSKSPHGQHQVKGQLHIHPQGYGFVSVEDGGPDVFIRANRLRGALHNDRVQVRVSSIRRRQEGEVVQILQRGITYLGGTLKFAGSSIWIEPDDLRIRGPLIVCEALSRSVSSGVEVIAEITRYPETNDECPEARIVEIRDPGRAVEFEITKIKLKEGIEETFRQSVLDEVDKLPDSVSKKEKSEREDLRGLDLITIDPRDAKDHDDAIWARRLKGGGFQLVVAIADVSHYVQTDSEMDREALNRGCTIYLPDRAIPMLPAKLSSNLASLLPHHDRLTLAVEVELGPRGGLRKQRFIRGVMRSRASLTYSGVARALGLSDQAPQQAATEKYRELLQILLDLSRILRAKRRRRGALMFELPEARVIVDPESGNPLSVERARTDPGISQAYSIVEEMMLVANETVARELTKRAIPTIFRIHPKPDPKNIETFIEIANSLGYALNREIGQHPKKLAHFLKKIENTHHAPILGYLLLRAMQQASYDTENVGHFALATFDYLHFTSPIRRYPDLAVHRLVHALIDKQRINIRTLRNTLQQQATASSQLERRAMKVEREAVDLYRTLIMRDRIGDVFDATIVSIVEYGFFATLDSPFVDVLCRISSFSEEQYEMDRYGLKLVGLRSGNRFALGDRIRVKITDVSLLQRRVTAIPYSEYQNDPSAPTFDTTGRKQHSRNKRKQKSPHRSRHGRRSAKGSSR